MPIYNWNEPEKSTALNFDPTKNCRVKNKLTNKYKEYTWIDTDTGEFEELVMKPFAIVRGKMEPENIVLEFIEP